MEVLIRIRNRRTNYFEHYELRGTLLLGFGKYITTQIEFFELILFNVGRIDNDKLTTVRTPTGLVIVLFWQLKAMLQMFFARPCLTNMSNDASTLKANQEGLKVF